jgi:hypothetical protein
MALIGLLGAAIGGFRRWLTGSTSEEQMQSALGATLDWFFSALLVLGPLVVMQIGALLYRRAERLAGPKGVPLEARQWQAPPWLAWPLWTIVTIGSLGLLYVLIVHSIPAFLQE